MTAFEWKTFFVWRVTYICVHVTQAQFLPTSSKHVSPGMRFLGLGIGGLSHQSCMSLHIGTNNIVGGSINEFYYHRCILGYLETHWLANCSGLKTLNLVVTFAHQCREPLVSGNTSLILPRYSVSSLVNSCQHGRREKRLEVVWINSLNSRLFLLIQRFHVVSSCVIRSGS